MSKLNKSWEKSRKDTHSPEGVEVLRKEVRWGLQRFYKGIAESMFRYSFSPEFDDMRVMSRDAVPEKFLMNNGLAVIFKDPVTEQCHILPCQMNTAGINMYGEPVSWSPVPVGWIDTLRGQQNPMERIRDLKLDATNSVIIRNDLFGAPDGAYIDSMVNTLVDNVLTMNQLQLLAKCPYVFNVTEDNVMTAKNFFLALASDKPVIFTNAMGDDIRPVAEATSVSIDPSLFDLFDRFECLILTYLGFPCVPISKRAQQSVSEVQSNDSKLYARRMEKLYQRRQACTRVREVLGVDMDVVSVVDEIPEQAQKDAQGTEEAVSDE